MVVGSLYLGFRIVMTDWTDCHAFGQHRAISLEEGFGSGVKRASSSPSTPFCILTDVV